ncbi:trihelix transcription factor DF1-like [Musa acuminata AAA Group]|uniref:trihelix transcription factor DF1-like n=1 Tax=Musa acuminata AAA Group TaxID=214697 RepID=UPI0031DACE5B
MQSGYGGVSEIQQFMVESCGPSLFTISSANPAAAAAAAAPTDIHSSAPHPLKYYPLPHPHHPHAHHEPQPPALPPRLSHFHSIPITQQPTQFQLFHPQQQYLEPRRLIPHHHLGLDQDSAPETSASPTRIISGGTTGGGPSFLAAAMSFKLAVNESSGGGSREGINDDDGGILQGDDGSESRLHHWQREDDSAIKELSWRPLDIDYINRNNKRCTDTETETSNAKYSRKSKEVADSDHLSAAGGSNYKIFSELEAIYKPGGGPNQTGSGSALTGDETPLLHVTAAAPPGLRTADRVGGTSETSAGEEAPAKKVPKGSGRRRRKRRQRQLSSVVAFFENLVKQIMDHQEGLHMKFLEVMERREQERTSREEAWRKQEAAKSSREAAARAQERALASSREAAIISFLEKITGVSLNLPSKLQSPDVDADKEENVNNIGNLQIETFNNNGNPDSNKVMFNTSRWPKAEVQALIRVRSGLESRFREPGLKGPLWEEVSGTLATMGYHRTAKRCKEKWENINKYFRKTKESGRKRPQHSKTCPYFQQLDQLYSKSLTNKPHPSSASPTANVATVHASGASNDQGKDNSELLDAIVVPADHQSFKFSDMGGLRFDFNNSKGDDTNQTAARDPMENNDEADEEEEEDDEEEAEATEGEGESQGQENLSGRRHQLDQEEDNLRDSSLFFQRLQS